MDFPCQALLLRTHPWQDSVKRKQTICSQGERLGISVSLQQGQKPSLEHRKGGDLLLLFAKCFSEHRKMPVIAKVQGTTTKPFSTNAVWEHVYAQVHLLHYFIYSFAALH